MLTFLDDTDSVPWQICHRILIRPHPAVWRLVHGLAVVYLVALTFLLFQVIYICGRVGYYSVGILPYCPNELINLSTSA
jgi:hypothetical protein